MGIKVPVYIEQEKPTTMASKSLSLAGEQRSPIRVPLLEDTKAGSIQKALAHISEKMYQVESVEQYNNGLAQKAKFQAEIKRKANEEWQNLSIDEHMQKYNEAYETFEKDITANTSNKEAREKLLSRFRVDRYETEADIRNIAYNRQINRTIAKADTQIDGLVNAAIASSSDAEYFQTKNQINEIFVGLEATGAITPEQRVAQLEKINDKIAHDKLVRFVDENPLTAYTMFDEEKKGSGTVYDSMDEDDKTAIKDYARRKYEAEKRETKKADYISMKAVEFMLEDDLANRANGLPGNDTLRGSFEYANRHNPELAEANWYEWERKQQIADMMGDITNTSKGATNEEWNEYGSRIKERAMGSETGGFVYDKVYDHYLKVDAQRTKALQNDPATWVRQYMPNATLFDVVQEQIRLGLFEAETSALTKAQASTFIDSLKSKKETGDRVVAITEFRKKHKEVWDVVLRDLVKAGATADIQLMSSIEPTKENLPVLTAVGDVMFKKEEDLKEALGPDKNNTIATVNETLYKDMSLWARSVVDSNPNNRSQVSDYIKTLEKIIYSRIPFSSKSPAEATKEISDRLINSQYRYFEMNDRVARVPVKYENQMLNIKTSINFMREGIDNVNIQVPKTWNRDVSRYNSKELEKLYKESIRERGYAVTKGDSLILMVDNQPVLKPDGTYISITFEEASKTVIPKTDGLLQSNKVNAREEVIRKSAKDFWDKQNKAEPKFRITPFFETKKKLWETREEN